MESPTKSQILDDIPTPSILPLETPPRPRSPSPDNETMKEDRIPPSRLPTLLPLELSAYSDQCWPDAVITNSTTTLEELAHIIRLHKNVEQKRNQSRVRLHRGLVSSALSARLLQCGQSSYRNLLEYYRNDDKEHFAELHSALHDVRMSCDAYRRYALLEPDLDASKSKLLANNEDSSPTFSTFLHEIPLKSRLELLAFLSELRCNPDFLAARIASLSEHELLALTSFRPSPNEAAVFASTRVNAQRRALSNPVARPVERLLSFHRHDSLAALIYTIFANSSGPDSAEDLKRTDCWATTCARLILESRAGWERFIPRVLDVYADMREWPAKEQFELYLMQILQEGQFLLEQAPSSKDKTSDKPMEFAAEEFYDRSVKKLIALIDSDRAAGGLPEGILEIGHSILNKLGPSKRHRKLAEAFILGHWFFGSFLYQALIYPEMHGIMLGYHISQFARERILREVASRTQRQILAIFNNVRLSVVILPEVRKHVENLFDRLRRPAAHGNPILFPAKTITAPKETVEVQPFLVLSPWDIVTLVKALFPEKKPISFPKHGPGNGLVSSSSSLSGQISIADINAAAFDNPMFSPSISSAVSDVTSRAADDTNEPDLQESPEPSGLSSGQRDAALIRPVPTEEYGKKLRAACLEMSQIVGLESASGTSHPCADRWAVLHISADGKELLPRMRKDIDEEEPEDDSFDSDSDFESSSGFVLENDYHYLKESIKRLLLEYELPKGLSDSTAFSNGQSPRKKHQRKSKAGTVPPYDPSQSPTKKSKPISGVSKVRQSSNSPGNESSNKDKSSELTIMLQAAYEQCQARGDYVSAHIWWKTIEALKKVHSPSLMRNGYGPLLHLFARGPKDSSSRCWNAIEEFEAWFVWLKQSEDRHQSCIEDMMRQFKSLRDNMWYKTMVLHSSGYEEARNLAQALKLMGNNIRPGEAANIAKPSPIPKSRFSKAPFQAPAILLKTEGQVLDLIAAPNDQCGPNKLSDEQIDMTMNWFQEFKVERQFCQGEERIHRFGLEIERCVNKLVGANPVECPVLWSSDLFKREQLILNGGRADPWLTDGGLCIPDAEETETRSNRAASVSLDFPKKTARSSVRSISSDVSKRSIASSDWSGGTKAGFVHLMDSKDYFGISSPALDIDSSVTFWSPLQASPSRPNSIRDNMSSASSIMAPKSPIIDEDEKDRFLLDLRRTLIGLLLSDLGSVIFGGGSETDSWFAEEVVGHCIKLKESEEQKKKLKLARKKSKRRLLDPYLPPSANSNRTSPQENVNSVEGSGTASEATSDKGKKSSSSSEFPFQTAYAQILRRFSAEPNPFNKLDALHSLRQLIDYQLSPPSRLHHLRTRISELTSSRGSPSIESPVSASGRTSGQGSGRISGGRVSTGRNSGRGSPADASTIRVAPSSAGATEILQGLFTDPATRPRTLFKDLQFISAFIPTEILENGPIGRSFIDISLAAVSLKEDLVRYMVEVADGVVSKDTQMRPVGPAAAAAAAAIDSPVQPSNESEDVPRSFSMSEAARMYHIAALEGNPAAARELAIFYLTRPDITPKSTQPFARSKEVFRRMAAVTANSTTKTSVRTRLGMLSGNAGDAEENTTDDGKGDTVCLLLAQHWMEKGRDGGDALAKDYLRGREEMERIAGA